MQTTLWHRRALRGCGPLSMPGGGGYITRDTYHAEGLLLDLHVHFPLDRKWHQIVDSLKQEHKLVSIFFNKHFPYKQLHFYKQGQQLNLMKQEFSEGYHSNSIFTFHGMSQIILKFCNNKIPQSSYGH